MTERPSIRLLVVRGDWTASDPDRQVARASWAVIDLLQMPYYLNIGYRVVGLDPVSERAWWDWRADHPEAV